MGNAIKKSIYWGVYVLLMFIGIILKMSYILPIKTTSIFLFGFMWIWTGISLICKINPYYAQKYERNSQLVFAAMSIGLGVTWSIISLTPLSSQAMPMILVSLPFLIPEFFLFLHNKRT